MLQIQQLTLRIADRVLLDRASLVIGQGQRVALVGRNGTGKTSLFRVLLGQLEPDHGSVSLPSGTRVGSVAQEAPSGEDSPLQVVIEADQERTRLLKEEESCHDPARLGAIHERLALIQAYSAPARAAQLLAGLGLTEKMQNSPCRALSGGWRMRVALAAALFAEPDLLLLDEPTNHLDLEATLWLTQYLRKYPHTLLLISHDRSLLNAVPEITVHLNHGRLTSYRGGYDEFLRVRAEQQERQLSLQQSTQAKRAHLQAFVDRFGAKASKARQAQSRRKALERLPPVLIEQDVQPITMEFPDPGPISSPLIALEDVSVGYGGPPILHQLTLRVNTHDRIALLGANGNGKSTLVKLLAGRLTPASGQEERAAKLRIGYFAQHQQEELRTDWTALEQASSVMPSKSVEKVRAYLGRFGFAQDRSLTLIGQLSGGEKARLLLALMAAQAPHLLILDEPSNHLDLETSEALCEALNAFEGAVVLISHDPHLIELCAEELWVVNHGRCLPFDGDLEEYRASILEKQSSGVPESTTPSSKKEERRSAAAIRAALAPLQKRVTDCEKQLQVLHVRQHQLEQALAQPELYIESSYDKLRLLQEELRNVELECGKCEVRWLEALEAREKAQ